MKQARLHLEPGMQPLLPDNYDLREMEILGIDTSDLDPEPRTFWGDTLDFIAGCVTGHWTPVYA